MIALRCLVCLQVKKVLVEGGGKHVNYLSDIVTHLIADNPDHQDVSEAIEIYEKPVVSVCIIGYFAGH